MRGTIFDIKEMAVHDGPGLRTTVFFKGCPLRCRWCHNPEGLDRKQQLMFKAARCKQCGQCFVPCNHSQCRPFGRCLRRCPENCLQITGLEVTSKELARELREGAAVMGTNFGGFTFSGGEPLSQPSFLLALTEELQDFHLCIETSGYAEINLFQKLIDQIDLVIMDVKLADSRVHMQYTGVDNRKIIENLALLKRSEKPHIIRTPLIPGITDTEENLSAIKKLIGDSIWEFIPYNPLAGAKYSMLGMQYEL